jgi:transcriptional regulator with XRE-family HTH domain
MARPRPDHYSLLMSKADKQRRAAPVGEHARLRELMREWRSLRNVSQLALALEANVSQRHLSFVESGRSRPSRDLILRIAEALDLPLRARNELLNAAGFAPVYTERSLDATEMRSVRDILGRILAHHEPYPAMVLDRSWNFVMRNAANVRLVARLLGDADLSQLSPGRPLNFLRLMFAEQGLHRRVKNWGRAGPALLARLRREARAFPGSPSEALLAELAPMAALRGNGPYDESLTATIPLELDVGPDVVLRITNTLTTFGTPQDVSVQELRVEMGFPLDDASDALLRAWANEAEP